MEELIFIKLLCIILILMICFCCIGFIQDPVAVLAEINETIRFWYIHGPVAFVMGEILLCG